MVFHRFDRQIFVATEAAEGVAETIAVGDFVETLDDVSYSITPFSVERNLVRPSFTSIPDYYASTGITSSDTVVAQIQFTFTIEMSQATGGATSAAPRWEPLLLACGMEKFSTVKYEAISGGTVTGGPFLHREQCTAVTNFRTVSTLFSGDTRFYYTGTDPGDTSVDGDISTANATITNAANAAGIAYGFSIDAAQGNGSSATVELDLDGRRVTAKGCRGTAVFTMSGMDRVLIQFTMTGIVHTIDDTGANRTGLSYSHQLPPTFVGAGLTIMEASGSTNHTGAIFQQITLDLGNEVTMRENANAASGWTAARITSRAPTLTVNPDAIVGGATSASVYDYIEAWAEGTPTRMAFEVGDGLDGNSFHFKMPALQWTGISDGDRNNYSIYDCSAKLTGGLNGDSVVHSGDGSTRFYDTTGADNELVIILT